MKNDYEKKVLEKKKKKNGKKSIEYSVVCTPLNNKNKRTGLGKGHVYTRENLTRDELKYLMKTAKTEQDYENVSEKFMEAKRNYTNVCDLEFDFMKQMKEAGFL